MEHRTCTRRPSRVELGVQGLRRKFLARLFDLSAVGCSFDCAGSYLHRGDTVIIKFTEHTKLKATVVRRDGVLAGVQFSCRLPATIGVYASGSRSSHNAQD